MQSDFVIRKDEVKYAYVMKAVNSFQIKGELELA